MQLIISKLPQFENILHSAKKMPHPYLEFLIKCLNLVKMWPNSTTKFQQYYATFIVTVTTLPILIDLVAQFYDTNISLTNISENLVALSALLAFTYVSTCFNIRKTEIKNLVNDLSLFENYSPKSLIEETDRNIQFYTKLFMIYGIIGNVCYGLLPLINYTECQKNRPPYMVKYGVPCGLVVRFMFPFKVDETPLFQITAVYEILICILCSTVIIVISMLICGILLHATTQLKYLQNFILEMSHIDDSTILEEKIKFCIKFHTTIIDYATRADGAFGYTMLLHISWTGFIISVLGFEITTTSDFVEAVRFFMHLLGWLGMLFLVCYYGQNLMDQSLAIADTFYFFCWYQKNVKIQKYITPIILRSQRALTLKAAGLKVMSLETFLGVLYTAYSYFTLLLKLS